MREFHHAEVEWLDWWKADPGQLVLENTHTVPGVVGGDWPSGQAL